MHFIKRALFLLIVIAASEPALAAQDDSPVNNSNVPALTRFLEDQPLNENARAVRAALLDWEDKSKDVVDVVCPGVFKPIPDKSIKFSGELLAQFIFGSAAYQLENPAEKGKLMPSQLAGMKSMLKAYRSFLAKDSKARIPRLDELSQNEADDKLSQVLEPLVTANCRPQAK
jgi:hypothetical protein